MSRFLKFLTFSALLTAVVGGLFWFWDQSLSANVMPGGIPEDDGSHAGAGDITDEEKEMLLEELKTQFG